MSAALDIIADLGADGHLSRAAQAQIAAHLRVRARALEGAGTTPVRVQVGTPMRSTRANALYWAVLGRISLAYLDAGRAVHADALHLYYKGLYLPAVAAEVEAETGEVLDVVRWIEMPDGSRRRTLTTTALTRDAFPLYLERIATDDDVLALGVDLADLLGERPRSGRVDEPDELRLMEYAAGDSPEERPARVLTFADLYE